MSQLSHAMSTLCDVGSYQRCKHKGVPLRKALCSRFQKRSNAIIHKDCEPIAEEARSAPLRPCRTAGLCLHTDVGESVWKFRNNFLRALKHFFKPRTALRSELALGRVVVRLDGYKAAVTNPWAKRDALEAGVGLAEVRLVVGLSIASMSFNPPGLPSSACSCALISPGTLTCLPTLSHCPG